MAPILFICHDTGNTNVLLTTAKVLLEKNPDEEIIFLIIGEAAEKIFNKDENKYLSGKVIKLTSWLDKKQFSKLNLRPLTEDEATIVASNLHALQPAAAITGCSCGPTALAPFQIVEMLTKTLPQEGTNYLYNGDFFQDLTNNPFWSCLSEEWIKKISLFVAFSEAVKQTKKANCYLAGSSALDSVLEAKIDPVEIANIHRTLEIKPDQKFLFIAGSKFVKDDLKLLTCLLASLQNHPETAVRMGMHPGTSDATEYVTEIFKWLDTQKIQTLKLVVNEAIAAKLSEQLRTNEYIKISNISGDQTFPAANAIASSQPSTLAAQAIMRQLPSFCLEEYKPLSYMHAFFAKSAEELFQLRDKESKLDKEKLGLPAERTVDIIGRALTTSRR